MIKLILTDKDSELKRLIERETKKLQQRYEIWR
jgi:hypothetical protein